MMNELRQRDVEWIARRMPKAVRELLKTRNGVFLAGGFIRACIAGEVVNDVDLFVSSKDEAIVVSRLLAGSAAIEETDNAYTTVCGDTTVQVIHRWTFETPWQCVESFDFTIACAAVWWVQPGYDEITNLNAPAHWGSCCDSEFYADLAGKRLVYRSPQRNEDAGGSILRVLKFYQRGYRIPLDSLGAVISRLISGIDVEKCGRVQWDEKFVADVVTGLLVEVDPNFAATAAATH